MITYSINATNILKKIIFLSFILSLTACDNTSQKMDVQQPALFLYYDEPAVNYPDNNSSAFDWYKALPIGNGRMGGMVFGGIEKEKLQLNEESVWGGYKIDRNNPGAKDALPKIRKLLFQNKADQALELAYKNLTGIPQSIKSFQTLSNLEIEFLNINSASATNNYYRKLDLDSALAITSFTKGENKYYREAFASHPDQVVVYRLSSDQPEGISAKISLSREKDANVSISKNDPGLLILSGQIEEPDLKTGENKGMKFLNYVKAVPRGGKIANDGNNLIVKNCKELILYITAATNYTGRDPEKICTTNLNNALEFSYKELKQRHVSDYQSLFSRVKIAIGKKDSLINTSTDKRVANLRCGKKDPYLEELFFQFGRYLLISHSRPGDLPGNLMGIWWGTPKAPWNGDYHLNINCQMNYWPAQTTNLAETNMPFFDLVDSISKRGKVTAQKTYGADGWVAHHLTDLFWTTAPADKGAGLWPYGGVWSVRQLYEHFLFNSDTVFLKERAYPLMKGAAQFVLDYLVEIPEGLPFEGRLVTNPSHSPENAFEFNNGKQSQFTYGATMDIMLIHDLFNNCIEALQAIDPSGTYDHEFRSQLEQTMKKLIPVQVNKQGRIQEWIEDYKETEIGHRHISHLFALYPANDISLINTPDLAEAARKSLERRMAGNPNASVDEANNRFGSFDSYINGQGGTGWGHAHAMNMYARLGDGDNALNHYDYIISNLSFPNLFTQAHRTFCVDANHGATAGFAEMLLQSHEGFIRILPALPEDWPDGKFSGLKARGGFTVSAEWKDSSLIKAVITSSTENTCRIYFDGKINVMQNGHSITVTDKENNNIHEFKTEKDQHYEITF